MAFSAITTRGSATEKTSDTSLAVSPSANITVGKLCIVCCVTDNSATADGASSKHSLSDTDGNVWMKIGEYTDTDGAAADGCTVSMWACVVTTQIDTTDSITLTTADAVTNKIISVFEATMASGSKIGVEQVGTGQTAIQASVSSLPKREYLLVGHGGSEGNDNTKTSDVDYTERFDLRTGAGTAATEIAQHVVTRIATLTSDTCTSTGWTNTNPFFMLAAIYEVRPDNRNWLVRPPMPRIEWDDPLTTGLVLDAQVLHKGGSYVDVANGILGGKAGTPLYKDTRWGPALDFSSGATTQAYFQTHPRLSAFNYMTVEFMIYMYNGGGINYGYIFCHEDDPNNVAWFALGNDNWDSGWGLRLDVHYTDRERVWSLPYPTIRKWTHYVIAYNHTNKDNTPLAWIDGIPASLTSRFDGAWAVTINADDFIIGNEEGGITVGSDQNFGGQIAYIRYWNRMLTGAEARALYEDPWRIYERPGWYQPLNIVNTTRVPRYGFTDHYNPGIF